MRYYKKMLRTFISIALIYVVVISTVFLFGYHYISQKEFKRSTEAKFNEMFHYTDSQIAAVREVSQVICASDLTKRYLTENENAPDKYVHLQLAKLVNTVNTLSVISGYSSILITKLDDNYAITNNSSGNLDYALNHLQIDRDTFDHVIQNFSNSYGISIQLLENDPSSENTTYHFVTRQWVNSTYPFYTLVTFSKDALFELDNLSQSVFVILKDDQIVASAGNMEQQQIAAILEDSNSQYLITEKISDTSGYSYAMITKRPGFFNAIIWLINTASILILLISLAIMYYITKKMYNPIAQTMNKTVRTEEDSSDEFTSIQHSFNLMQNNIVKIEHQLEQYYISSENKFFYDLLTGLIPKEQLQEKFREFDIFQTSGTFVTVLVRFSETQTSGTDTSHNLLYQTRRSLLLAMKNNSSLYRVVDLSLILEAFIFRSSDISQLTSEMRNICLNVEPDFGLEISAYIGSVSEGLQNIHSSFLQASYLANQAEYSFSYNKVIVQSELQEKSSNKYTVYYPISIEQSLIGAVTSGKTTIWKNALINVIDTNKAKNPDSLSLLAQMLATTINRIISTATEETHSIFESNSHIYKIFLKCTTYDELSAKTEETIITLTEYLEKKVQTSSSSIRKKMTDYIHQNYTKDISLINLADHLNMSKNYISSLFKETTGYNFKEYLSEYRINKARELINEKGDKIKLQDVAAAVGCNKDSLLRLFMRYEGMTPSEYQRKVVANKQSN